jgi:hypothetical protein
MTNEVNTARLVRTAATVPEICMHNVKLGPECFCPLCPTASFEVRASDICQCMACGSLHPRKGADEPRDGFGPQCALCNGFGDNHNPHCPGRSTKYRPTSAQRR